MAPRARVGRPSSRYPWLRLTPFNLLALGLVLVLGIAFFTRIPALNGYGRTHHLAAQDIVETPSTEWRPVEGHATKEGMKRFADRHAGSSTYGAAADGLLLSTVGLGTYLGDANAQTDRAVEAAVEGVVRDGGWNVLDTAINYRQMRAERSVGRALKRLLKAGEVARDELFIATKAGFVPADSEASLSQAAVLDSWKALLGQPISEGAVVRGRHCIDPACLEASLTASTHNLDVATVDLLYLHNAWESQCNELGRAELMGRLRRAFKCLEAQRRQGRIRYYGLATWTCFRSNPEGHKPPMQYLALEEVVRLADEAAGPSGDRGLRFIQVPINLTMLEAVIEPWQPLEGRMVTLLQAAEGLGVSVMASRSVNAMQGDAPDGRLLECAEEAKGEASKRLHLTRSMPGLLTALVGVKGEAHVTDAIEAARLTPIAEGRMRRCLEKDEGWW